MQSSALILGIDPGSVETGVVVYRHPDEKLLYAFQTKKPEDVTEGLHEFYHHLAAGTKVVVLIEDYQSGGHLTKDAKRTIMLVGHFYHHFLYYEHRENVTVKLVPPQRRRAYVRSAAAVLGGDPSMERDPKKKDTLSALAHCLAERASWR